MRRIIHICLASALAVSNFVALFPIAVVGGPTLSTSSFFAKAWIEAGATYRTISDGDLWPSCWADDDNLYAANGDGRGFTIFSLAYSDIAVNRISGTPPKLTGQTVAMGNAVGQIWNQNGHYNRKPTGLVCVDNAMYLAIQDLNLDYNDAPSASISKSIDHGLTWTWDTTKPMFNQYQFTTIMFLDYGKDSANAIDAYVYAYGLDNNWRESVTHSVSDPLDLYLARVPKTSVQNRSTWQFYSGVDKSNAPIWSPNITLRLPVLHFDRVGYLNASAIHFNNLPALTQGGIVYNKPLNRYIYSAWTQYTFEFYEAPQPWGPWQHFLTQNFGAYPWSYSQQGGYATTIPSKFISDDGKVMWVQSNVCPCGDAGMANYMFSLRRLFVEPNSPPSTVPIADSSKLLPGVVAS